MTSINEVFAADIAYHVPGRNFMAGDYEGIDAVIEVHRRDAEETEGTSRSEVLDVFANDERAVVITSVSGRRKGRQLDQRFVEVFRMVDGKVAETWIHPADQYALDEFWS